MTSSLPAFTTDDTLLPAIAQCVHTGKVLMMAWMNREAFEETCQTKFATYYSRSRKRLWRKGEESGHRQKVESIYIDCDGDTILLHVEQTGAACHEGYPTCFFRRWENGMWVTHETRLVDPQSVYGSKHDGQ